MPGTRSEPGCALPNLFGPGGLSLYPQGAFPHYAHFIGSAQETLNQTLSTSIATQLAVLPIVSPSSGFTYQYDSAAGAFVRSTTSFGPSSYTERAETIGRGKVLFGTSYQRFRFSKIDGIDLHNVPAVFEHVRSCRSRLTRLMSFPRLTTSTSTWTRRFSTVPSDDRPAGCFGSGANRVGALGSQLERPYPPGIRVRLLPLSPPI